MIQEERKLWTSVVIEKLVDKKENILSLKVTVGKATIEVAKGFELDTFRDMEAI